MRRALRPAGDRRPATVRVPPLPFGADTGLAHVSQGTVEWQAVADGRLYVLQMAGEQVRITAYVTDHPAEPGELGGVPASDWPDTCALAPRYRNLTYPDAAARAATIGPVTLHNAMCARKVGDEFVTVTAEWVAATPQQAHTMLTHEATAERRSVDGADEAYVFVNPGPELWIRAGRYILKFDKDAPQAAPLASAIAKELRGR